MANESETSQRRQHWRYRGWRPPYPDPDRAGCYRVPLSGRLAPRGREAVIDAESLPLIEGRRWNWSPKGSAVVLAHSSEMIPLRRIVMGITDTWLRVRHVNGDPFDCRRANLVVCTMSEQMYGTRKMGSVNGRRYTSRFKGVCWCKQTGKWVVQIRKEGTNRKIGRFRDEIVAAEAYDRAAHELLGAHALLNFPDDLATSRAAA